MMACARRCCEVLPHLAALLLLRHLVGDLRPRLVHRLHLGFGGAFELDDLVAAGRPQHARDLPDFERRDLLQQLRRQVGSVDRADEAAVGLGRGVRHLSRELVERLAGLGALAQILRLGPRRVVFRDVDALLAGGTAIRISRSVSCGWVVKDSFDDS